MIIFSNEIYIFIFNYTYLYEFNVNINSISILFKNEKKLETESNKLQSLIKQHSKDVLQWNDLTKMLDNSLKVYTNIYLINKYINLLEFINNSYF